jgi:hypothetical protein
MASLTLHPVPCTNEGEIDMRYYTMLADTVPSSLASPAVILDCMLLHVEQRVDDDMSAHHREQARLQAEANNVQAELPKSAGKKKGKTPRPASAASSTSNAPADVPVLVGNPEIEAVIAAEFAQLLHPTTPSLSNEPLIDAVKCKLSNLLVLVWC